MVSITGTPLTRELLLRVLPNRPLTAEQAFKRSQFEEAISSNKVHKLKGSFQANIQKIIDIWTSRPGDAFLMFTTTTLDFSTAIEKSDSKSILRSFHTVSPRDLLLAAKRFPKEKVISLIASFTLEVVPRLKGTLLPLIHSFEDLTVEEMETLAQTCKDLEIADDPDIQEALAMRCSKSGDPKKFSACLGVPEEKLGFMSAMLELIREKKKTEQERVQAIYRLQASFSKEKICSLDEALKTCRRFMLIAPRPLALWLLNEPNLLPGELKITLNQKKESLIDDTLLRRLIQFGTLIPEDALAFVTRLRGSQLPMTASSSAGLSPAALGRRPEKKLDFQSEPVIHVVASEYNPDDYEEDVAGEKQPGAVATAKRPISKAAFGENAMRSPLEEPERKSSGSASKKPKGFKTTSSWKIAMDEISQINAKKFLEIHLLKALHGTLQPEDKPTLAWDIYARARLLTTDELLDFLEQKIDIRGRDIMYPILPPMIHAMGDLSQKQLEKLVRLLVMFGFFPGPKKMVVDGKEEIFHTEEDKVLRHDEKDEDLKYIISMRCPHSIDHMRGYYRDQYGFTSYWTSKEALKEIDPIGRRFGVSKRLLLIEEAYIKRSNHQTPLEPIQPLAKGQATKYCKEKSPYYFVESARWHDTSLPRDPDSLAVLIRKRMIACSANPMHFIIDHESVTKPVESLLPKDSFNDCNRLPMIDGNFVRFLMRIGVIHPNAVNFD